MQAPELETGFTVDWLLGRRWFRSKQRQIAGLEPADLAPLAGEARLLVLRVRYLDGGEERYLVPCLEEGGGLREPRDGDGVWQAFVRRMAEGAEVHGEQGRYVFDATSLLGDLVPSPRDSAAALDERRLGVEQSNTSVVLGERLILKVYRLLEEGLSPDLEVPAFLAEVGFADTPPLAGSVLYLPRHGEASAAAMLQAFVPSHGDAWATVLGSLATDPAAATHAAAAIGELTARLHAALAARPDYPAFPARRASVAETAAWRASAERQLALAESALSGEPRQRLERLAPALRARFADAFGAATASAMVSRVHGDYHLGQLLAGGDGRFRVIDFEGEPARTLAERRQPASPLRDVAGMLRSFDYAARTAERGAHAPGFDAASWLEEARASFLAAYPPLGPGDEALLRAFEFEKACYELRYEANNRPSWTWLPLEALERMAGG